MYNYLYIYIYIYIYDIFKRYTTVEPVHNGLLGTYQKCPNYQDVMIFLVIYYDLHTIKCVDYAGVRSNLFSSDQVPKLKQLVCSCIP